MVPSVIMSDNDPRSGNPTIGTYFECNNLHSRYARLQAQVKDFTLTEVSKGKDIRRPILCHIMSTQRSEAYVPPISRPKSKQGKS